MMLCGLGLALLLALAWVAVAVERRRNEALDAQMAPVLEREREEAAQRHRDEAAALQRQQDVTRAQQRQEATEAAVQSAAEFARRENEKVAHRLQAQEDALRSSQQDPAWLEWKSRRLDSLGHSDLIFLVRQHPDYAFRESCWRELRRRRAQSGPVARPDGARWGCADSWDWDQIH